MYSDIGVSPGNSEAPFNYSLPGAQTAAPKPAKPTSDNQFRRFWTAGYTRLIPIAPPGCDVSPTSSLAERQEDIGKVPGELGPNGWRGLPDWQKRETTEADLDRWHKMGAGIGLKTGDGLIAVDIDVMDKVLSELCGTTATQIMGASLNRIGRRPRRAKLYRTSEPVPYQRITFDGGVVEILSDGKQLVVHGIHPGTGQPYEWERGLPRYDELPVVSAAQVAEYMAKLREKLPAAKHEVASLPTAKAPVDPALLAGREEDVRKAMAALPNNFDDRETYIRVGQALKGALPNDPQTGFELFDAWAAKWPDYNAANTAADWQRYKPSHSLGAKYLYHLATLHSGGTFSEAEIWFTDVQATETDAPAEATARSFGEDLDLLLTSKPITDHEWNFSCARPPCIIEHWFYEDVGHLAAPGGVGKTTLLLFQAIHIVLGRDLFEHRIKRSGPVVYLTSEDDRGTMIARLRHMCQEMKLAADEIRMVRENVHIIDVAGRGFKLTKVENDVVVPSDGVAKLIEKLKSIGPTMVFIDPLVSFGVGESRVNDAEQGLVDVGRRLRNEIRCGVHFVHHTGKENARNKTLDQYSGRGGSALSDGSRVTHVMQSLSPEDWTKATGDILHEGESGVVYARPKVTWAPPNQPVLYLKRKSYLFEHFDPIEGIEGADAQLEANAEKLYAFLKAKRLEGTHYTAATLANAGVVARDPARDAISHLIVNGRVAVEPTPGCGRGRPTNRLRPLEFRPAGRPHENKGVFE
jgi:RecA-family ATPase